MTDMFQIYSDVQLPYSKQERNLVDLIYLGHFFLKHIIENTVRSHIKEFVSMMPFFFLSS